MPPPHGNLRGRAIGMFYASRGRKRRKDHEARLRHQVVMDPRQQGQLERIIGDMQDVRRSRGRVARAAGPVRWQDDIAAERSRNRSPEKVEGVGSSTSSPGAELPLASASRATMDTDVEIVDTDRIPFVDDDSLGNRHLLEDLAEKKNSRRYRDMLNFRKKLPSYEMQNRIVDIVASNQVCVISGETGCGKTTQVPQFILDNYIEAMRGVDCRIVCTQPRRISALGVSARVADERAEPLGVSCGYSIRMENKYPRAKGSMVFCTTGILLRWMHMDPLLEKVSHVILDEVHERSAHSDILMTILRRSLRLRPSLKVILMSATLNAEQLCRYFDNCASLHIPGFTFPVDEFYLEHVLELTGFIPQTMRRTPGRGFYKKNRERCDEELEVQNACDIHARNLDTAQFSQQTVDVLTDMDQNAIDVDLMCTVIDWIARTQPAGAVLTFVPGWEQIRKIVDLLNNDPFMQQHCLILPLHSLLPTAEQKVIFDRPPPGKRKIIIATSIAETSITVDDVVYVVDSGKLKESNFDVEKRVKTLQPEWVNLASAKQRRGRAGRVQKGYCYHLYCQAREHFFKSYQDPEITRIPLDGVILELMNLRVGDVRKFFSECLTPPSEEAVELSLGDLHKMNAIDSQNQLTPLGRHLALLPVEPTIGKFILYGSIFSCLDPVLTIAACLTHKDPFVVPLNKEKQVKEAKLRLADGALSDPLVYVNAVQGYERHGPGGSFCYNHFLSVPTLKFIVGMKEQLAQYLKQAGFLHSGSHKDYQYNRNSRNQQVIKAMVVGGFYPSVIKVLNHTKRSILQPLWCKYRKVDIHIKSVASDIPRLDASYLVNYMRVKGLGGVSLHDVSPAHPYALILFGGEIGTSHDEETGVPLIEVDTDIKFKCDPRTADTIIRLRQELSGFLQSRLSHRTSVETSQEALIHSKLIQAVVDLISMDQPS